MLDPGVESAYAFLRGHTSGDLRFDEHLRPIKYVIAPDGRLVASVMVAMLQTGDTVLFIPQYAEGCMELQVTLLPLDERGPDGGLTDRWRIYHGDPEDVRWGHLEIDAARYGEFVIDGEALMRQNALSDGESAICRRINENDREDLRMLCRHHASIEIEAPVLVGVDPLGFDVRGAFEVTRVPAAEPMPTVADVERVLEAMTAKARSG